MSRHEKLLSQILRGASDANIPFDELIQLLRRMGFDERTRGSHHIFRKPGVEEKINLQRDGSKAKAYQVRQVRNIILKYRLGGEDDA
ncbi:MAG: type II toxin-antitoxin system HicA family toxin [Nitrospiraceae bacterium]